MRWITDEAKLVCRHRLGKVANRPSQHWVRIDGRALLVEPDPEGCPISGCPNLGPAIKPCTNTLRVQHGYSAWIRIGGQPVCLDSVRGLTDGTPPGVVEYIVAAPGQDWVDER